MEDNRKHITELFDEKGAKYSITESGAIDLQSWGDLTEEDISKIFGFDLEKLNKTNHDK